MSQHDLQHPKTDSELEALRQAEEQATVRIINGMLARIAALETTVADLTKGKN